MAPRAIIAGIARVIGALLGSLLGSAGLLVLVLTVPTVLHYVVGIVSNPLEAATGVRVAVGAIQTDLVSYLDLADVRVDVRDGPEIAVGYLHARYDAASLVRARLRGIRRLAVHDLDVRVPLAKRAAPFRWTISPYLPYVPEQTVVRDATIRVISARIVPAAALGDSVLAHDTTTVRLHSVALRADPSAADSSLTASLEASGTFRAAALGDVPLSATARLFLIGPLLRADSLEVSAPGATLGAYVLAEDVATGPYAADVSLRMDLGGLPRRATGIKLSGKVALEAWARWAEKLSMDALLDASDVVTPWVAFRSATVQVTTEGDSILLRATSEIAGGVVHVAAEVPQPPATGQYRVAFDLVQVRLPELARVPVLREALGPLEPGGEITLHLASQGPITGWLADPPGSRVTRLDLSGRHLVLSGIDIGPADISLVQEDSRISGSGTALGAHVVISGTAPTPRMLNLAVEFSTAHLDSLLRPLRAEGIRGALTGHVDIVGSLAQPNVVARMRTRDLVVPGVDVGDVEISAELRTDKVLTARVVGVDSLLRLYAVVSRNFTYIDTLSARVGPWSTRRLAGNLERAYGLVGAVTIRAHGSGPIAAPRLGASLETTPLVARGRPLGSYFAQVTYDTARLDLSAWNGDRTLDAAGVVRMRPGEASHVAVRWHDFLLGGILAGIAGSDTSGRAILDGITDGSLVARWRRGIADSTFVRASVARLQVRVGDVVYGLAEPPATLTYAAGDMTLAPLVLEGANQRIYLQGHVARDGRVDATVRAEHLDLAHVGRMVGRELEGTVNARLTATGTVRQLVVDGRFAMNGVRAQQFAIDSLGFDVGFQGDTLDISRLRAQFPTGTARGSFVATTSALGLGDTARVRPEFALNLALDRAGVSIGTWEGIHPGIMDVSGVADIRGRQLGDLDAYRGTVRIDSLRVLAPFARRLVARQPFVIDVGSRTRPLPEPAVFWLWYGKERAGTIRISQPPDTTIHELDLELDTLSIGDLRHILLPVGGKVLPEDLSGTIDLDAAWDMNLRDPQATLHLRAIDLVAEGFTADSILADATAAHGFVTLTDGALYAGSDTLQVGGRVSLTGDSVEVYSRTDRLDLIPIMGDIFPPLQRVGLAAPLPTVMPLTGYSPQMQRIPAGARGEEITVPLTTFDDFARRFGGRPKHGYAALLPVEGSLSFTMGPKTEPGLGGQVRLLGGYVGLEWVLEPFWFPDTVVVDVHDATLEVPAHYIHLGSQPRAIYVDQATYSIENRRFDVEVTLNRPTLTMIRTQPVLLPRYLRPFGFIVTPFVRAYNTDPIGTFTGDGHLQMWGTARDAHLWGNLRLYRSYFRYPIAKPMDLLRRAAASPAPGWLRFDLALATVDSLIIENNLTEHATASVQATLTGSINHPAFQGRFELSPGSSFRYLGRDFTVTNARVDFPDPTRLEPELAIAGYSRFTGLDGNDYVVEITISGTYPNRITTSMTATEEGPGGEVIADQQEVLFLLVLGTRNPNFQELNPQGRFNTMLVNTGFATVSTALETVIPIERIAVQQQAAARTGAPGEATQWTEVEVTQSFRIFGQRLVVTAAAPVTQISGFTPQRTEVRWTILSRPSRWQSLESLSLTLARTSNLQDVALAGLQDVDTTADVQIRIRF